MTRRRRRWLVAGVMFVMTALLWLILLGWIIHLWSIIDAAMYDLEAKKLREVSDGEIARSVENFDLSELHNEQVRKVKVTGNIDKIVFLKIGQRTELEQPFEATLQFTGL